MTNSTSLYLMLDKQYKLNFCLAERRHLPFTHPNCKANLRAENTGTFLAPRCITESTGPGVKLGSLNPALLSFCCVN